MAKERIKKLSEHLGLSDDAFDKAGIFDPFVGIDTHLFLDPALLNNTKIAEFKGSYQRMVQYFAEVLKLLKLSKKFFDIAWKEAWKRLIFRETRGISIGYGEHRGDGGGIGPVLARKLTETASEIVGLGIDDPAIFEIISLFQEDFGADRLSDMTISIIIEDISAYTQRVAREMGIQSAQLIEIKVRGNVYKLVRNPLRSGKALFLLPRSLLRDLPVALTRDDIGHIAYFNEHLRRQVSSLIIKDAAEKLREVTKVQFREILLTKIELPEVVSSYKSQKAQGYDFEKDPKGEVIWSRQGKEFAEQFPLEIKAKKPKTIEEVSEIVRAIIQQFKRNIESNELYELLYVKKKTEFKPRNERYAQRLFYSVADSYCQANNVMLSREPNAGNGPVDFKIGSDYDTQVLVELKLSTGKVRSGFENQLPEYQENENAKFSFLVVLRVTRTAKQIDDILAIAKLAEEEKRIVPEIIVIDALPRESASKSSKKTKK